MNCIINMLRLKKIKWIQTCNNFSIYSTITPLSFKRFLHLNYLHFLHALFTNPFAVEWLKLNGILWTFDHTKLCLRLMFIRFSLTPLNCFSFQEPRLCAQLYLCNRRTINIQIIVVSTSFKHSRWRRHCDCTRMSYVVQPNVLTRK
jgi:hypothetical protein